MEESRLKILHMIQDGVISAEEGETLLDALDGDREPGDHPEMARFTETVGSTGAAYPAGNTSLGESVVDEATQPLPAGPPRWVRQIWIYPLAGGVLLLALTGVVTALLVQGGDRLGWLVCSLPLMVFGALVVALAWWSRTARWLHVRIHDAGTRINFSLPLPLRPVAWLARLARPWVPQLRDTVIDELILSLAELGEEDVLALEVNEGEGEEVWVYFG